MNFDIGTMESISEIHYFLLRKRTEDQIAERFGNFGLDTVKGLKQTGVVISWDNENEITYELNVFYKPSTYFSYALYTLGKKIRSRV